MSMSDREINRAAELFTKKFVDMLKGNSSALFGNGGSGGGGIDNRKGGNDSQKEYQKEVDKSKESLIKLSMETKKLRKDLADQADSAQTLDKTFKDLIKSENAVISGIARNEAVSNKKLDSFPKKIGEMIKDQSEFTKAVFGTIQGASDLDKAMEKSSSVIEDFSSILESSASDASKTVDNFGGALDTVIGSNKELNDKFNELLEVTGSERVAKETLLRSHKDLIQKGIEPLTKEIMNTRAEVSNMSHQHALATGVLSGFTTTVELAAKQLGIDGWMGQVATVAGSLALLSSGLKEVFKDFTTLAARGLSGEYGKLSGGARSLGISLEEYGKIVDKNRTAFDAMGASAFNASVELGRDQLTDMGFDSNAAAEGAAAMLDVAMASGINASNTEDLNAAMKSQIAQYDQVKDVMGESIEQFSRNNLEIATSKDNLRNWNNMSKSQRIEQLKVIGQQRESLRLQGYSNESMKKMIATTNRLSGLGVTDRVGASNQLLSTASILGDQGIADIANKVRSGQEIDPKALTEAAMRLTARRSAARESGNLGEELMIDKMIANLEKATKINVDEESKVGLDAQQRKVDRAAVQTEGTTGQKFVQGLGDMTQSLGTWLAPMGEFFTGGVGKTLMGAAGMALAVARTGYLAKIAASTGLMGKGFLKKGFGKVANVAKAGGAKVAGLGASALGALGMGTSAAGAGGATAAGGVMGKAGGIMKGVGKTALKAVPFLGAALAITDSVSGAWNADEAIGKDVGVGGHLAGALGGLASGLSFGLLDSQAATRGIYSAFGGDVPGKKAEEKVKEAEEKVKEVKAEEPVDLAASLMAINDSLKVLIELTMEQNGIHSDSKMKDKLASVHNTDMNNKGRLLGTS